MINRPWNVLSDPRAVLAPHQEPSTRVASQPLRQTKPLHQRSLLPFSSAPSTPGTYQHFLMQHVRAAILDPSFDNPKFTHVCAWTFKAAAASADTRGSLSCATEALPSLERALRQLSAVSTPPPPAAALHQEEHGSFNVSTSSPRLCSSPVIVGRSVSDFDFVSGLA